MNSTNSTKLMLESNQTNPKSSAGNHLSTGAIVGIVIGCLLIIILLLITAFILYKRIQRRRKNHGEYRPQLEEELHGKGLPTTINPPSVTAPGADGLI